MGRRRHGGMAASRRRDCAAGRVVARGGAVAMLGGRVYEVGTTCSHMTSGFLRRRTLPIDANVIWKASVEMLKSLSGAIELC